MGLAIDIDNPLALLRGGSYSENLFWHVANTIDSFNIPIPSKTANKPHYCNFTRCPFPVLGHHPFLHSCLCLINIVYMYHTFHTCQIHNGGLKVMMGCTITSITFARVSVQCSQGSLLSSVAGAALVLQALVRQLG